MSWVVLVDNETRGDHVQHSAPLTWRKNTPRADETKHQTTGWIFQQTLRQETGRITEEQMKKTFFLLSEEGSSSLPGEKNLQTVKHCWWIPSHITERRRRRNVLTHISSLVLLFWRLSSSPPSSFWISSQVYFWKQNNTQIIITLLQTFQIFTCHLLLIHKKEDLNLCGLDTSLTLIIKTGSHSLYRDFLFGVSTAATLSLGLSYPPPHGNLQTTMKRTQSSLRCKTEKKKINQPTQRRHEASEYWLYLSTKGQE